MGKSFDDLNGGASAKSGYQNLLVVDGLNLAFRYKRSKKRNFAADYINTVRSLANSYEAKDVVILSDWGQSQYRLAIDSGYKGDRRAKRDEQTPQDEEEFKAFLEDFNKALDMSPYPIIKLKGVEADDTAAYISKYYKERYNHIWLVSSDKDWDLLVNDKVSRFSYVTRKETTEDNWSSHYEYDRESHISIKVLQGDKGDSVPGIPLVGEKRAAALVRQYGSAFDIYDQIPLSGTQKFIQNINEFGDQFLTNYELMDLLSYCETAVGQDNVPVIEQTMESFFDEQQLPY